MDFTVKRQLMKSLCVQSRVIVACLAAYSFNIWKMWMDMFFYFKDPSVIGWLNLEWTFFLFFVTDVTFFKHLQYK